MVPSQTMARAYGIQALGPVRRIVVMAAKMSVFEDGGEEDGGNDPPGTYVNPTLLPLRT